MNAAGLLRMVKQCMPKVVIAYHPGGDKPKKLASYLNRMGIPAIALADIDSDSSKRGRIDHYQ
jgi:putative mRNA 3-end processing factor